MMTKKKIRYILLAKLARDQNPVKTKVLWRPRITLFR